MKKVIYDFGANNGDDIPYYLLKADVVVAVEANPKLCNAISNRFENYISDGRLFVENCVLAETYSAEPVVFLFINTTMCAASFQSQILILSLNLTKFLFLRRRQAG